jgi:hypothetical protein
MAKQATRPPRLLLNAEPFGFGPAAAIAFIFPYLRERFTTIGYTGKGHTLDLQRSLPYDAIHDLTGLTPRAERARLKRIFRMYDVLVTALDFGVAELARQAGLAVIIYDPLAWYWKKIPRVVRKSSLYLAQDFFGVQKRIRRERAAFPEQTRIVPPITEGGRQRLKGRHVLINLGGLQNPFFSKDDVTTYARSMIHAIRAALPAREKAVIATSATVAHALRNEGARSYTREQMIPLLAHAKYAFMTSGLGNIYDSAHHAIPTIWLPPTNDSQGQQAVLLHRHGMADGMIGWRDVFGRHIDPFSSQPRVLRAITAAIHALARDPAGQETLEALCRMHARRTSRRRRGATERLLQRFGSGGARIVADKIYEHVQQRR